MRKPATKLNGDEIDLVSDHQEDALHIRLRGGKQLLCSEPYSPHSATLTPFIGREDEQRLITAAWMGGPHCPPLSPILTGEPGVGKNRLVYELAKQCGRPLYIMQGHEDLTPEDLACSVRFRDDDGHGMEYVASPLLTAMHRGGICFLDEIGKIRPRALSLLVSVLDERRYIDSTLLGERVHADPNFRFIAATNSGELELLPEFIQSRMRPVIEVAPPPKAEIEHIVSAFLADQSKAEETLDRFWSVWAREEHLPSPRDAIQHFSLATSLSAGDPKSGAGIREAHMETAFKCLRPFATNS